MFLITVSYSKRKLFLGPDPFHSDLSKNKKKKKKKKEVEEEKE